MSVCKFFALTFVLYILFVQFTVARFYLDEDQSLKRSSFQKSTAVSAKNPSIWSEKSTYSPLYACQRSPCQNGGTCFNVHDDYWCKCPGDYYGVNCQTKFYSSSDSKNYCRPNICHTGQCISLKTTYYCQCPNDRYGEHCEKRYSKRGVSFTQSYDNLFHHFKRGIFKQNTKNMKQDQNGRDKAFYDPRNGIYY